MMTSKVGSKKAEQIRHPLFCTHCETTLNKCGEDYFAKIAYRGGEFPLYNLLKDKPRVRTASARSFDLKDVPEFNKDAIIHFAMGILYRAALWSDIDPRSCSIRIEPLLLEEIRCYLIGIGPLPKGTVIQLIVIDAPLNDSCTDLRSLNVFPYVRKIDFTKPLQYHAHAPHEFAVCGLLFIVTLGHQFPNDIARDSLEPGNKIYREASDNLGLMERTLRLCAKSLAHTIWTPSGYAHPNLSKIEKPPMVP
jgi:hypothetical protein